jgi:uncharacterized protein (TIGR02996 family)
MPTPAAEQAFLEPILARPRDDGPRLVFADFLEETGDEADAARGELVRVQCALARISADHPRRPELVDREAELLQAYRPRWAAHLAGLVPAEGCEFRRGLLDAVAIDTAVFLARGDELFRRAPVRRVRLLDAARHLSRLVHCPFLARVRELDLCAADLGNGGLNLLLRSPYLTAVESLDLGSNGLCDGGAYLLSRATGLPAVRELALHMNGHVSSRGVQLLAESPHLAGLRSLDLSGNDVGDAGVTAIASSRYLTRLDTLRLFANHIGDAGVAALAGGPLLARVTRRSGGLDLRENAIGPAGVRALAGCPAAKALTALDLSGNYVGDDGLRAVAGSEHLAGLRRLAVRQNRITDAGAAVLSRSPLMPRLAFLDVSSNQLTNRGVDLLWNARRRWDARIDWSDNLATPDRPAPGRYVGDSAGPPDSIGAAVGAVLDRVVSRVGHSLRD